ncbi:MAG: hypothetical protein SFU98_07980 [Leptospiraceae bacterium]|nr:hypothetical protein [Leptospiraceae bacterium]
MHSSNKILSINYHLVRNSTSLVSIFFFLLFNLINLNCKEKSNNHSAEVVNVQKSNPIPENPNNETLSNKNSKEEEKIIEKKVPSNNSQVIENGMLILLTWDSAQQFCGALNKRLLTKEEALLKSQKHTTQTIIWTSTDEGNSAWVVNLANSDSKLLQKEERVNGICIDK